MLFRSLGPRSVPLAEHNDRYLLVRQSSQSDITVGPGAEESAGPRELGAPATLLLCYLQAPFKFGGFVFMAILVAPAHHAAERAQRLRVQLLPVGIELGVLEVVVRHRHLVILLGVGVGDERTEVAVLVMAEVALAQVAGERAAHALLEVRGLHDVFLPTRRRVEAGEGDTRDGPLGAQPGNHDGGGEIGRASCRERV